MPRRSWWNAQQFSAGHYPHRLPHRRRGGTRRSGRRGRSHCIHVGPGRHAGDDLQTNSGCHVPDGHQCLRAGRQGDDYLFRPDPHRQSGCLLQDLPRHAARSGLARGRFRRLKDAPSIICGSACAATTTKNWGRRRCTRLSTKGRATGKTTSARFTPWRNHARRPEAVLCESPSPGERHDRPGRRISDRRSRRASARISRAAHRRADAAPQPKPIGAEPRPGD